MKLLLDENLPHDLRTKLLGHDFFTVRHMNWSSYSNGQLMALAATELSDALITKDQGLAYQQNLGKLPIAVVILQAKTNKMADIEPLVPKLLETLAVLVPKTLVFVR